MITPRRTRLVRVANLHAFRRAIVSLANQAGPDADPCLIVVPARGAARQLQRTIEDANGSGGFRRAPELVTRDELHDRLHARLADPPRRLTTLEREAILRSAARESAAADPPGFALRPGLLAEMLRFYDQLRRQSQSVRRFAELLTEMLGRDEEDRGARRMLRQTRFLAGAFDEYERRVAAADACDEHGLRDRLAAEPAPSPVRHLVVTVADWIAEPNGLYLADFDLLTRLPGLETVDLVATDALLASGFHQRVHEWLPGIEETDAGIPGRPSARPLLAVPTGVGDRPYFVCRDREEELVGVARRLKADRRRRAAGDPAEDGGGEIDRIGVVYKRPLPYVYLGRAVFGAAGVPCRSVDALPLAAEPFAAALALVFDAVLSGFSRAALMALLRSPHFRFSAGSAAPPGRADIAAFDRALSEGRYLGGADRLAGLVAAWSEADAARPPAPGPCALAAAVVALDVTAGLVPLTEEAAASAHLARVLAFVDRYAAPVEAPDPLASRLRRARAAVLDTLAALAAAHAAHDAQPMPFEEVVAAVRRCLEEQTFAPEAADAGLHLLDDQAARYGEFDELTIVGLVEGEWPERPRRNIFYPTAVLRSLGWPSEQDRRAAADARFLELLASPTRRVAISTVLLDDEALVEPSSLLDEIGRAGLSPAARDQSPSARIFVDEALSLDPPVPALLHGEARAWIDLRLSRSPRAGDAYHGRTAPPAARAWSVSAIEGYLGCPFKFFAERVLRLAEEPADEEVMDPRRRGQFVHTVFEAFFEAWQASGHGAVTPEKLDAARALFADIVEQRLAGLPDTEAVLERTRLLGSPVAAGLGEAVLRMEAERPVPVVSRLLEHRLEGAFTFDTASGPRTLDLKGKADRIDLLADGTFRLVDYKLGYPTPSARALQLPVYGLCAEQRLSFGGGHAGRRWRLGEAAYIAFSGPRRIVALFQSETARARVLAVAQQRLVDAVDGICSGEFPPRPCDVHLCLTCSYAAVCRKDYVGDV